MRNIDHENFQKLDTQSYYSQIFIAVVLKKYSRIPDYHYIVEKSIIVCYLARTWSRKEREIDIPLLV